MKIKPLKHYAIPSKCQNDNTGCPFVGGDYIPKSWEPRYMELTLSEGHKLRDEQTGDYTPQGGCSDGTFIYRCLVKSDDEATKIQKIDLEGNIVTEKVSTSFGHANDMTYCSKDNLLYIAHSSSTSVVYKVNPETLELVDTINVGPAIWGIDYNATDDLFILGNVGSAYLSVYTYDFKFMYRIKMQNAFTAGVRQGISCNENYIFIAIDNAYGTVLENEKGSRLYVYTWNGMFIKSIFLNIAEIEFAALLNNELVIGTYEGRNTENIKSGRLFKVPFDLYPGQTVLTGRPTDVSGGLNNLQRLSEGTPVRLWDGGATTGEIKLQTPLRLVVDEDGPFRYLRFRFKGANQQVFDWYPVNNGVATLREIDITDAQEDTTIRIREARLVFNKANQTFTIDSNFLEEIKQDVSENKITITKDREGTLAGLIEVTQIWGVV